MISETKKPISTKFGNAVINTMGYYVITNHENGHHLELLHRLIFEDFYKSVNLETLKQKVIAHGHEWIKLGGEKIYVN